MTDTGTLPHQKYLSRQTALQSASRQTALQSASQQIALQIRVWSESLPQGRFAGHAGPSDVGLQPAAGATDLNLYCDICSCEGSSSARIIYLRAYQSVWDQVGVYMRRLFLNYKGIFKLN